MSVAAPADTPAVFSPGVISNGDEQWRITFTPDGDTAYFAQSEGFFPATRRATIWVSRRRSSQWSQPEVAPFSGSTPDMDPFITRDGQRLYFTSIRPVEGKVRGDLDIWYVERIHGSWGPAVRAGDEVNSSDDELYPSASRDGTLYFASGPLAPAAGRHFDIYRAGRTRRGFAPREVLDSTVNTTPRAGDPNLQSAWDFNPEISPDGKLLIFTSLRPGYGLGDLYASHLTGRTWSVATNLGPTVNTVADEYHPTLSRAGDTLYFVRRVPRRGDFYVMPTRAIPALRR